MAPCSYWLSLGLLPWRMLRRSHENLDVGPARAASDLKLYGWLRVFDTVNCVWFDGRIVRIDEAESIEDVEHFIEKGGPADKGGSIGKYKLGRTSYKEIEIGPAIRVPMIGAQLVVYAALPSDDYPDSERWYVAKVADMKHQPQSIESSFLSDREPVISPEPANAQLLFREGYYHLLVFDGTVVDDETERFGPAGSTCQAWCDLSQMRGWRLTKWTVSVEGGPEAVEDTQMLGPCAGSEISIGTWLRIYVGVESETFPGTLAEPPKWRPARVRYVHVHPTNRNRNVHGVEFLQEEGNGENVHSPVKEVHLGASVWKGGPREHLWGPPLSVGLSGAAVRVRTSLDFLGGRAEQETAPYEQRWLDGELIGFKHFWALDLSAIDADVQMPRLDPGDYPDSFGCWHKIRLSGLVRRLDLHTACVACCHPGADPYWLCCRSDRWHPKPVYDGSPRHRALVQSGALRVAAHGVATP